MSASDLHEVNQSPDAAFPVALYCGSQHGVVPHGRGLMDYHWHEELQITMITSGSAVLQVGAAHYALSAGEALYIGSGLVHAVTELSQDGTYASLNFPAKLLGFFPGSRMEQQDVLPFTSGVALPVICFRPGTPWHDKLLSYLQQVIALFGSGDTADHCYQISVCLAEIWLLIRQNQAATARSVNPVQLSRLQTMLHYLYAHYADALTLQQLAASANISTGECCRTFRRCLGISPYRFLKEYRIRRAMELLSDGASVTDTAQQCGYQQDSNFIAAFRSITGTTPLQYAKSLRESD